MTSPAVEHTGEFQRVAALPRRVWSSADLAQLAAELTAILRLPNPAKREELRPMQALALHDAAICRGLFAPLGVGEGKTLITMLLAIVLGAQKPLLLLPGGLVEKAQNDRRELAASWRVTTHLRVHSYDLLGRVEAADELHTYRPDLIIADEAHRLKNKRAAVTRRVARYMHDFPMTTFCALSGSFMDQSIVQYAHILCWCLKTQAPIPLNGEETREWAEALDHDVDPLARRRPGALLKLCAPAELEHPPATAARLGFQRRLTETPGVVATVGEGLEIKASIHIVAHIHDVAPVTEANFEKLRRGAIAPDDWPLKNGVDWWRVAQELALGLHYAWDPRPPEWWLQPRAAWGKFVRDVISRSRTWDSELHVANACDAGRIDGAALEAWRAVREKFIPNVVPVWHDDSAINACARWMQAPGLVWSEHGFFAQRLAERTGAPYYGSGGFAPDGRYIERHPAGSSAIASIDANREGKNLQAIWNRMLFVCPPSSATWWEQTIARVHRPGQTAERVVVDILLGCRENFDAVVKALTAAQAVQETMGKRQKLLLAEVRLPTEQEIDALPSCRWRR